MNLQKAIQLLKDHNEWRREDRQQISHRLKMTDPKKLGVAIDIVVNEFENLFISGVSNCLPLRMNVFEAKEDAKEDLKKLSPDLDKTSYGAGWMDCYDYIVRKIKN